MKFVTHLGVLTLVACTAPDTSVVATRPPTPSVCDDVSIVWMAEPNGAPLVDGDSVELAHGPQGGWHVAVNAGVTGPTTIRFQPVVTVVSTGLQVGGDDNAYDLRLWNRDDAACSGEMRGMIAYLDDDPIVDQAFICSLEGERLQLDLMAGDDPVLASVEVVGRLDPRDECL